MLDSNKSISLSPAMLFCEEMVWLTLTSIFIETTAPLVLKPGTKSRLELISEGDVVSSSEFMSFKEIEIGALIFWLLPIMSGDDGVIVCIYLKI